MRIISAIYSLLWGDLFAIPLPSRGFLPGLFLRK